jgi:hypothetical protein
MGLNNMKRRRNRKSCCYGIGHNKGYHCLSKTATGLTENLDGEGSVREMRTLFLPLTKGGEEGFGG